MDNNQEEQVEEEANSTVKASSKSRSSSRHLSSTSSIPVYWKQQSWHEPQLKLQMLKPHTTILELSAQRRSEGRRSSYETCKPLHHDKVMTP
ncbi:unnamed protein product [Lampetra planeri]